MEDKIFSVVSKAGVEKFGDHLNEEEKQEFMERINSEDGRMNMVNEFMENESINTSDILRDVSKNPEIRKEASNILEGDKDLKNSYRSMSHTQLNMAKKGATRLSELILKCKEKITIGIIKPDRVTRTNLVHKIPESIFELNNIEILHEKNGKILIFDVYYNDENKGESRNKRVSNIISKYSNLKTDVYGTAFILKSEKDTNVYINFNKKEFDLLTK